MKKAKKALSIILSVCLVFSSVMIFAQASTKNEKLTEYKGYVYPVQPGTEIWAEFTDLEQKIEICQITEEILQNMSTEDLVQTVLNYPLMVNMFAFNTYEEGFESVLSYFNGMQELVKRQDATVKLMNAYKKSEVVTKNKLGRLAEEELEQNAAITSDEKACIDQMFKMMVIESLLSTEVLLEKLNENELELLDAEAFEKFEAKLAEPEIYNRTASVFYDSIDEQLQTDVYETRASSPSAPYQYKFIGTRHFAGYYIYIKTPRSSDVLAFDVKEDYTVAEKNNINQNYGWAYPNATYIASATATYNCHSYAWYKSVNCQYWIDSPIQYINDGSYYQDSFGNIIIYYNISTDTITHSGRVKDVFYGPTTNPAYNGADLITVTSKWGAAGLYTHSGIDCPYWVPQGGLSDNRVFYFKKS